ncbi:DUF5659 domain-containing protein [uncultured Clostridium sp.]|uniref:DUF5659 domain-containing protein n=1 Tax=uncultured Clostridium sp. TaxID=59620 RepID=UPI00260AAB10|nr:DUF5659 domain-containing protein [uncultured Clostridium sp.]
MNKDKYTIIDNKYLAHALNFAGFRYMQFSRENGNRTVYSFENTEDFKEAMQKIIEIRNEYNKY